MAGPYLGNIYLDLKVYGGSDIKSAIHDLVKCATHLCLGVWADCNDVRVHARPDDDADELYAAWVAAANSNLTYKIASTVKRRVGANVGDPGPQGKHG